MKAFAGGVGGDHETWRKRKLPPLELKTSEHHQDELVWRELKTLHNGFGGSFDKTEYARVFLSGLRRES